MVIEIVLIVLSWIFTVSLAVTIADRVDRRDWRNEFLKPSENSFIVDFAHRFLKISFVILISISPLLVAILLSMI